jgi:hypothetical protein
MVISIRLRNFPPKNIFQQFNANKRPHFELPLKIQSISSRSHLVRLEFRAVYPGEFGQASDQGSEQELDAAARSSSPNEQDHQD